MKKYWVMLALLAAASGVAQAGDVQNGKALAEKYNCASCHGKDFNTPIDPSYPKLAGQHESYLVHALTAYRRGDAANGRGNAIMAGQAKALSNKDINDIAAFLHSQQGSLVLKR
jgi:cytochrome c553